MISHPELDSDPPFESDRDSGYDITGMDTCFMEV